MISLLTSDFQDRLSEENGQSGLYALEIDTVQVNVGLKCDLACSHCHVVSSPKRTKTQQDPIPLASILLRFGAPVRQRRRGHPRRKEPVSNGFSALPILLTETILKIVGQQTDHACLLNQTRCVRHHVSRLVACHRFLRTI